jgi:hypothetical protein
MVVMVFAKNVRLAENKPEILRSALEFAVAHYSIQCGCHSRQRGKKGQDSSVGDSANAFGIFFGRNNGASRVHTVGAPELAGGRLFFETPFPRTERNFWELLGLQNHSCRFYL